MAIRTLLVGCGFSAVTFHLPFVRSLADFELTGVVSSSENKVAQHAPGVPVFEQLEDAFSRAVFDLVIITTPNHLHARQARAALLAGCHVLVEKPFTLSSQDAMDLVALAEQCQKQLCVYHNRRFDGDFLTLKTLIAQERLGDVKRLESRFDRFRPVPRDRWRENAGPGAGIFWDLGPHLIDQAIQLFGVPVTVSGSVQILRDAGQSDDTFDVTLYYKDKQVVVGSSPFQAGKTLRFDMQGTKGSYRSFGLDPQEDQLKAGIQFDDPDWAQTPPSSFGELCTDKECSPIPTCRGGYLDFYQQLADALQKGTALPADAHSVVPVIQVIEAAQQASEKGARVSL